MTKQAKAEALRAVKGRMAQDKGMRRRILPGLIQNEIDETRGVNLSLLELVAEYGYKACEDGDNIQMMRKKLHALYQETLRDADGLFPGTFYIVATGGGLEVWQRLPECRWQRPGNESNTVVPDEVIKPVDLLGEDPIPQNYVLRNKIGLYIQTTSTSGAGPRTRYDFTTTAVPMDALRFSKDQALKWASKINKNGAKVKIVRAPALPNE
jgi:hypothetical protein